MDWLSWVGTEEWCILICFRKAHTRYLPLFHLTYPESLHLSLSSPTPPSLLSCLFAPLYLYPPSLFLPIHLLWHKHTHKHTHISISPISKGNSQKSLRRRRPSFQRSRATNSRERNRNVDQRKRTIGKRIHRVSSKIRSSQHTQGASVFTILFG